MRACEVELADTWTSQFHNVAQVLWILSIHTDRKHNTQDPPAMIHSSHGNARCLLPKAQKLGSAVGTSRGIEL